MFLQLGNALLSVLKTPALLSVVPAVLLNSAGVTPPLLVLRIVGLLGQAMIPVMVLSLGVQLAATKDFRIDRDVVVSSLVRLVGGPLLAFALAISFALEGLARSSGIAQASMPTAVLASNWKPISGHNHETANQWRDLAKYGNDRV